MRALFAWIEAFSHLMRCYVRDHLSRQPLSRENLLALLVASEKTYYLDDDGDPTESRLSARTSNLLLFSLKSFARAFGVPLSVDKGGKNWQDYSKALKIRDRLTHPKHPSDVEITDAELDVVREARGMMIGLLQVFRSPDLIAYIQDRITEAKTQGIEIKVTLTEQDLRRFGIE